MTTTPTTTPTTSHTTTAPTTAPTTHTVLRAEGFTCPSCVARIEKRLDRLPGVAGSTVHFSTSRIEVDHDPALAPVDTLVAEVARAGYRATPAGR